MRLHEWPSSRRVDAAGRVGVVMVSYNTIAVTAQAIYALLRTIRTPEIRLVVIDNASTDGPAELLTALAEEGLHACRLFGRCGQPSTGWNQ